MMKLIGLGSLLTGGQANEFDALTRGAEARVKPVQADLDKTIVRAPVTGVILRKRLKEICAAGAR